MPDDPAKPEPLLCPHCGGQVENTDPAASTILCPHCQNEITLIAVVAPTTTPEIIDDTEQPEEPEPQQRDELDALRIRHRVVMRRSAIRARSYCLIAVITCIVIGIQAADNAYEAMRPAAQPAALPATQPATAATHPTTAASLSSPDKRSGFWVPVLWIGLALLCVRGATYFGRRMVHYGREAAATAPEEPATPPDFSTLSDGSQHWRALEDADRPPTDPKQQ